MISFFVKYYFLFFTFCTLSYASTSIELELFLFDDVPYFSIEEFCQSTNYPFNYYQEKSKIDFFIKDTQFIFANNSSFVTVGTNVYHMLKMTRLINDKFYLPLNSFIRLSKNIISYNFSINYTDNKIYIKTNLFDPQVTSNLDIQDTINTELLNTIHNEDNWKISTVIIDPGHGGKDPGAIGYHGIKEKHIALDIAKELGAYINKYMPEVKVVYTRDDDTFLGLKNRTFIANKNQGHMFLSIHANASTAKTARGFEIFVLQPNSVDDAIDVAVRENASIIFEDNPEQYEKNLMEASISETAYLKESEKLAVSINTAVKKELPRTRMRGVKQAGFYVLVGAAMPKVLIEAGFLTNKSEAQLLNKSKYRSQMAYGIFKGVHSYIESYNSQNITR